MKEIEKIRREDFNLNLAWLGGFFDGEGNLCIGLFGNGKNSVGNSWKTFRIIASFYNNHMDSIEKASKIIPQLGCSFKVTLRKRESEKHQIGIALHLRGQENSIKFIKAVMPYLTCKLELARQAIYAYEYRKGLCYKAINNQYSYKYSQKKKADIVEMAQEDGAKKTAKNLGIGWSSIYRWKKQIGQYGIERFLALSTVEDRVQDDPILLAMVERARELTHWNPDPFGYSRKAGQPVKIKKPSEAIRLTALSADEMVRPSMRVGEPDGNGNDLATIGNDWSNKSV